MWTLKQFETVYDRYQSGGLRVKEFAGMSAFRNPNFITGKGDYVNTTNERNNLPVLCQ
jgi:hypothetical protein